MKISFGKHPFSFPQYLSLLTQPIIELLEVMAIYNIVRFKRRKLSLLCCH